MRFYNRHGCPLPSPPPWTGRKPVFGSRDEQACTRQCIQHFVLGQDTGELHGVAETETERPAFQARPQPLPVRTDYDERNPGTLPPNQRQCFQQPVHSLVPGDTADENEVFGAYTCGASHASPTSRFSTLTKVA